MPETKDEAVTYRLAKKSNLWVAFTPTEHGSGDPTWQMQVSARGRGGTKTLALLLETTALHPLATVTLKGESYPLTIGWHSLKRGGVLCFGGERKTGLDGGILTWEMQWKPLADESDTYSIEMRIRATPRREGHLDLNLNMPLHRPECWSLDAAAARGHHATVAWSAYNAHFVGLVLCDEAAKANWDEIHNDFVLSWRGFPLGGGKALRFSLQFGQAKTALEARQPLVTQYAAVAEGLFHPIEAIAPLSPEATIAFWTDPCAYAMKGTERLYFRPPLPTAEETFYAGFPHYPPETLKALWDWHRLYPSDLTARLVRFGARGIAADFQVMGRAGQAEPNKGAFWDKVSEGVWMDHRGEATHGIAANARIARAFFLLYEAEREPLFLQSALNICQWLILKQNSEGYYESDRVYATREQSDDGKFLPGPCLLDGAEAIRPLVLAFRATANEVFIKAAWKVADFLLTERMQAFESSAGPSAVASVITALLALDAEAPKERLRVALYAWGAWLRTLPIDPELPSLNADGFYCGLYECAQAGFGLHILDRNSANLRYAFAALAAIPPEARVRAWRSVPAYTSALLSVSALLSEARPDLDALSIVLGWRTFAPDPATQQFLRLVAVPDSQVPVHVLPLVCRLNDQLLLTVLAPPTVEAVTLLKNGKRPLLRDLFTNTLDSAAELHFPPGQTWARVGLFTIDP